MALCTAEHRLFVIPVFFFNFGSVLQLHRYYIPSWLLRHSVMKFARKFGDARSSVRNFEGGGPKRMVKADDTTRRVGEAIPEFHKCKFLSQLVWLYGHWTVATNLFMLEWNWNNNIPITSVGPSVNCPFLLRFTVLVLNILMRFNKIKVNVRTLC
jgi:hypothetical protein